MERLENDFKKRELHKIVKRNWKKFFQSKIKRQKAMD